MNEIEIDGIRYRVNRMNVFDQAHVARKVAPIISSMGQGYAAALAKLAQNTPEPPPANGEEVPPDPQAEATENAILFGTIGPIAEVLSKMEDEDVNYVLKKCLSVCQRYNGTSWAPLMRNGSLMFDDVDLATMIRLTWEVVQDNLAPSLRGLLGRFSEPTDEPQLNTLQ